MVPIYRANIMSISSTPVMLLGAIWDYSQLGSRDNGCGWRSARQRRPGACWRKGFVILCNVCLGIPVVNVPSVSVHQSSPWVRQGRISRGIPRRSSSNCGSYHRFTNDGLNERCFFHLPFRLSTAAVLEQEKEQTNWNCPHVKHTTKTPITSSFHMPQVSPTHTHHFHSHKSNCRYHLLNYNMYTPVRTTINTTSKISRRDINYTMHFARLKRLSSGHKHGWPGERTDIKGIGKEGDRQIRNQTNGGRYCK